MELLRIAAIKISLQELQNSPVIQSLRKLISRINYFSELQFHILKHDDFLIL